MLDCAEQDRVLKEFLAQHVRPYDLETDDYDRPPFAADIREGKNDPIYNAHSYHTKVPPRSIIPYILHYTRPGDLVLDPFCGSGMTGVAAQMCAKPPTDILEQFPELKDRVGPRACILNDLSPAACHIAYNYNTPVDVDELKRAFERIKTAVKDEFDWLYGTEHYEPAIGLYDPADSDVTSRLKNPPASGSKYTLPDITERTWELLTKAQVESRLGYEVAELPRDGKWHDIDVTKVEQWMCIPAMIEFTVWSDTHRCEGFVTLEEQYVTSKGSTRVRKTRVSRGCGKEIVLWDVAVDARTHGVLDSFACPHCQQQWKKTDIPRIRSVPVLTRYEIVDVRGKNVARERPVTRRESKLIQDIDAAGIAHWYPQEPWDDRREMWRGGHRDANIRTTADFYTVRSLRALALFWHHVSSVKNDRLRRALQFVLTSISGRYAKTTRYLFGKAGNSGISGTLYVASFTVENALPRILGNKWADVLVALETATKRNADCFIRRGSAGDLSEVPESSVDYVFADPPFGSNIFYGDCSFLWESWLNELTDLKQEAVWNKSVKEDEGGKSLGDYGQLMAAAFKEMFRVLKPGRWATVEFNNSDGKVFAAIKDAIIGAGFHIANMLLLDKTQKSFKQTKGATGEEDVVDKDVLFNLYKPAGAQVEVRAEDQDLAQQIAVAVREHLQALPDRIKVDPTRYSDEHRTTATINSMLMNTLIPRGVSVERINLPAIERLCGRYFRKVGTRWYLRGEAVGGTGGDLIQEEVPVTDEVSAIAWLRQKVTTQSPLTGELMPLWMKATGLLPASVSQSLVLEDLLISNFWRDEGTNRWREPTEAERDRMNDDKTIRVLHDAERYVAGNLRRPTTDAERCEWVDALFKMCRALEENDSQMLPSIKDLDPDEGYRLIGQLFQGILKDGVPPATYSRTGKQAAVASQRIVKDVEDKAQKTKVKRREEEGPTLFDL